MSNGIAADSALQTRLSRGNARLFAVLGGFALLIGARLLFVDVALHLAPWGDEDNLAARGPALYRLIMSPLGADFERDMNSFYQFGYWPPFFSIVIAPAYYLLGYGGTRIYLLSIDCITGLLFFILASRILPRNASIVALYIYAIHPTIIVASYSIMSEGLYNLLIFASLIVFISILDNREERSDGLLMRAMFLGLLMGCALLTRSAFILVSISFAIFAVVYLIRWPRALLAFFVGLLLMFSLTIPWNLVIANQEGRFMFLQTISSQQLYMKFVPGGSWTDVRMALIKEGQETGRHHSDVASDRLQMYFSQVRSYAEPLRVMVTGFLSRYVFGENELEERMKVGFYDFSGAPLLWPAAIFQALISVPIVVLGGMGLFVTIFPMRYRILVLMAAGATGVVGLIALASGRHFVSLLPFLILGASTAVVSIRGRTLQSNTIAALATFLLAVVGFNMWQRSGGEWSSLYHSRLEAAGHPHGVRDLFRLRRENCDDAFRLSSSEASWDVRFYAPGASEPTTVLPGEELEFDDIITVEVIPKDLERLSRTVKYTVGNKRGRIPLVRGRQVLWMTLPNTCILFSK